MNARTICGLCVLAALALPPGSLHAQGEKVAADAAFDEGKKLMESSKYDQACARFAESQRLDPASSTLLWLGDCYEKSGKLASAWSTFREAASLSARQGRADREKTARERVAALEPRVPRVVLRVPGGASLSVSLDGVALGSALWNSPLPVDAGKHSIEVSAPGKRKKTLTIEVTTAPGPQPVDLPPLDDEAAAPPPSASAPPSVTAPKATAAPAEPPPAESSRPGDRPRPRLSSTGLLLGGLGLALAAGGVVLQVGASSKADESRTRNDRSLYDDAKSQQTVAIAAMVAGGALVTAGVLVLLTTSRPASAALRLQPAVSSRGGGLWLAGGF